MQRSGKNTTITIKSYKSASIVLFLHEFGVLFLQVLLLDGKLQSAEADEFVYHESIVHPALLYHSKSVLNSNFHNLPKQTQSLEFSPVLQT